MNNIFLYCSVNKCPRQLKPIKIDRDEGMPKGTKKVMQPCPWHEEEGNKGEEARYFDKDGKELYY